ncbi:MAG: sigma-70 family RNA polymerase sigma factor, partial [Planctomycetota bacterium]
KMKQKIGASDVVQDVCLLATQRFESFRGSTRAEFRGWLRRALLNRIADSRRRFDCSQKRRVTREVELDEVAVMVDSQRMPHSSLIAREESVKLMSAMKRLPEDYRVVLRLRNWDLLTFDEIGKLLERSGDAAQKLWTRAVKRLEQELMSGRPQR